VLCCAHRLFASSRDIVPTHRLLYGGRQVNAPARTGEDAVLTPLATADVWPFAGLRQGGTPCSGEVNSCKCALTARRTPRRHAPARAPAGRAGGARAAAGRRDTRALSDLLRAARPRAAAERVAHPGRSDRAADDRGDAAVQAHLPGPGAARARARATTRSSRRAPRTSYLGAVSERFVCAQESASGPVWARALEGKERWAPTLASQAGGVGLLHAG